MIALPTTPTFRLDGRRAWVSGASQGIGLAAARAVAEAEAYVNLRGAYLLCARAAKGIMGAAGYLVSDAGRLVTGTELLVDGGWTAGSAV